ncbi:DUF6090 family protein [Rasiella sp. SM2506]|uniref:DUF6090 family protein n=1 Tax=Rasiella sp. SM2506 TaxID=3423914 RepID=UPI003D7B5882
MIKFFRKIRERMIIENKFSKYLLYAIGEIVLVVIGILIALSINNWNENRKLQREEVSLLLEVKSNLEVTLHNFKNDTLLNTNNIIQLRKIEHYIEEDLPYDTELDIAFGLFGQWQSPYPITTAYTTLKTKGLDVVSNKPLRNKIVTMYEFEFVLLHNDYDKGEWGIVDNANIFLIKHIRSKNSEQSARPNDFENLKDQVEFSNIVGKIIAQREVGLRMYKTTIIAIVALIEHIDIELMARK